MTSEQQPINTKIPRPPTGKCNFLRGSGIKKYYDKYKEHCHSIVGVYGDLRNYKYPILRWRLNSRLKEAVYTGFKEFDERHGIIEGSNPYSLIILNKVLEKDGKWISRPCDLEKAIKMSGVDLEGTWQDSALILRGDGDPNKNLAGELIYQIKERDPKIEFPVIIPYPGLNFVEIGFPGVYSNEFGFRLTDETEIIPIPNLQSLYDYFGLNDQKDLETLSERFVERRRSVNKILQYFGKKGLSRLVLDKKNQWCEMDDLMLSSDNFQPVASPLH